MKMTMDQDVIMSRPKQQAMQKLVAQDDVTMLNKFPMKRTTNENKVQGLVIIQKQISNMLKGQQLKTMVQGQNNNLSKIDTNKKKNQSKFISFQ